MAVASRFHRTGIWLRHIGLATLLLTVAGCAKVADNDSGDDDSNGCVSYTQSGGTAATANTAYCADATDESAVTVSDSGVLTLTSATVTSSGNTSSQENSSFYGQNAAVLAKSAAHITLTGGTVTSTGTGANGVFAYGTGSTVELTGVTIKAGANGGHGVMASGGGVLSLRNVAMTTAGANSGVIATDRGGGTITVSGGSALASGQDSPGIYSTGAITVGGATISATGAEAAVIEGANSITLTDTALTSSKADKWGVMIYQSMSGDATGTRGLFTMTGGALALTAATGPLFYVTNSTGVITLANVTLTAGSGVLLKAAAGNWGNSGANGGTAILNADRQALTGDLVADSLSSLTAVLQNGSSLVGAVNAAATAASASLSLDAASSWTLTADSHLTCLADSGAISGSTVSNITGNGHNLYYQASACTALGGRVYALKNGGFLTPF